MNRKRRLFYCKKEKKRKRTAEKSSFVFHLVPAEREILQF
jgi:hypothetical protein